MMKKDELSVVFCGQAGQGINTIEVILSRVMKNSGYHVFATKEYMSRIRGGLNSTWLRISSRPVKAFSHSIDILCSLGKETGHMKRWLKEETLILSEYTVNDNYRFIKLPFGEEALKFGSKIYSNIIAVGVICGILNIEKEVIYAYLKSHFSKNSPDIVEKNIQALDRGYEIGEKIARDEMEVSLSPDNAVKDDILINGTEAFSLGAIGGGCNFISAYPMTPGTGVFTYLSGKKDFSIIAEQAEDEIGAINMVLGAWYGGARAMTTTSGGGFALMSEGTSLSGITEIPAVIHIAQRPGPATGLPTRTEQGDLELALYAGHGEFPRIILTPGTSEDMFHLARKSFELADKYQVPVIILTDQFLIDSYYNMDSSALNFSFDEIKDYFSSTSENYKRYELSSDGISPRGIPGYGKGVVVIDSDEHDREGHITEDFDIRVDMVNKRLKKLETMEKDIIEPELLGEKNYSVLLVGWGSTCSVIEEVITLMERNDMAFLYFKQVYPLHSQTEKYLKKADKVIIIENNATGQFQKLIKLFTGIEIKDKILKYNGLPFSVEEILTNLKNIGL